MTIHAQTADYKRAYTYALRCFVANDHDERAQKIAYDAAMKLGQLQGLTEQRVTKDFHQTIATESIRIGRSKDYRKQLLAECRQIGMAS